MATGNGLAAMLGMNDMPSGDEIRFGIEQHVAQQSRIESYLQRIAESDSHRPDFFEFDTSGVSIAGPAIDVTLTNPFFVPIGKRLIVYRAIATCVGSCTGVAQYGSPSGQTDGNSLVNFIVDPPGATSRIAGTDVMVYDSSNGFVVHGGSYLVTVFAGVAFAGTLTAHYEGSMFTEETEPLDIK